MRLHWRDSGDESHAVHSGHPPVRGEQIITLCGLTIEAVTPFPFLPTCDLCEEVIKDMENHIDRR